MPRGTGHQSDTASKREKPNPSKTQRSTQNNTYKTKNIAVPPLFHCGGRDVAAADRPTTHKRAIHGVQLLLGKCKAKEGLRAKERRIPPACTRDSANVMLVVGCQTVHELVPRQRKTEDKTKRKLSSMRAKAKTEERNTISTSYTSESLCAPMAKAPSLAPSSACSVRWQPH